MSTDRTSGSSPSERPAVLLCEGDRDLRVVLAALLEGAGHRVVAAADAREAVSRALAFTPGCIVLDMSLRGGDPSEILRSLKGLSTRGDVPAILIAPPGLRIDAASGFRPDRDARFPPTFRPADLLGAVARLTGSR